MKKLILLTAMILMAACQTNTEPVMSDDEIKSALKENAVKLQNAILDQDLEEFNKHVDQNMPFTTGDSNLSKFYVMNSDRFDMEQKAKWGEFDLYDINVSLSSDSKTAVLTFYAKGDYTVDDSESIDYSTRASSVWVSTSNGWKIMHSNWAPLEGGTGIPK
jgi:ketosteroid isomerase-like protein|tara:strand:+ start:7759 stop:8241 length:483 start_codon:yes stop_codon:yes gene_type:complete